MVGDGVMKGLVRMLYVLTRLTNDLEKLSSGSPKRIGRRLVNKAIGRKLVGKLYWRG